VQTFFAGKTAKNKLSHAGTWVFQRVLNRPFYLGRLRIFPKSSSTGSISIRRPSPATGGWVETGFFFSIFGTAAAGKGGMAANPASVGSLSGGSGY